MNDKPLISIVVPAYNAENLIVECCQSVINQTYYNWELIVVDDGSKDNTLSQVQNTSYKDNRINVLHIENSGVSRARNIGLEMARGEYVMFLDADDLLVENALEVLYGECKNTKYDMVVGWKTNMDMKGNDLGCPYLVEETCWNGTTGIKMSLRDHPATYAVWGKLYRKDFLKNIHFVEGRRVHEDSFFLFQCFCRMPSVKIIKNVVIKYRITPTSASRSDFSEKYLDILYFSEEKTKIIENEFSEFRDLAKNAHIKANMALLHNLKKGNGVLCKTYEKKCIKNIIDNKAYFIPAIKQDKIWNFIIIHHLYYPYKYISKWMRILLRK